MSRDGFANCSSPDTPPCAGARPRRASVDAFSQSAAIETAIDHAQSDVELKIEQLGGHSCSRRSVHSVYFLKLQPPDNLAYPLAEFIEDLRRRGPTDEGVTREGNRSRCVIRSQKHRTPQ